MTDPDSPNQGATIAGGTSALFPPAPWQLRGRAYGTVWLVKSDPEPQLMPPGVRIIKILGRSIAITFWVDYGDGSTLQYREFLCAVIGRIGRRLCATTTHIWVDSPVSKNAGNVMWGIPKELAEFNFDHGSGAAEMRVPNQATVRSRSKKQSAIPGRLPIRLLLAQPLEGRLRLIRIHARARVEIGTSDVTNAAEAVPQLLSARPILHVRLTQFDSVFDG